MLMLLSGSSTNALFLEVGASSFGEAFACNKAGASSSDERRITLRGARAASRGEERLSDTFAMWLPRDNYAREPCHWASHVTTTAARSPGFQRRTETQKADAHPTNQDVFQGNQTATSPRRSE